MSKEYLLAHVCGKGKPYKVILQEGVNFIPVKCVTYTDLYNAWLVQQESVIKHDKYIVLVYGDKTTMAETPIRFYYPVNEYNERVTTNHIILIDKDENVKIMKCSDVK